MAKGDAVNGSIAAIAAKGLAAIRRGETTRALALAQALETIAAYDVPANSMHRVWALSDALRSIAIHREHSPC